MQNKLLNSSNTVKKNIVMQYMSKIQVGGTKADKDKFKISIALQEERYFEGKRVSQVINSNVNQILVALWDEPGFFKIDRRTTEQKITKIEDTTNIPGNINCTDLVAIRSDSDDQPTYIQYYIARTQAAINIVDTVKEKVYCLIEERNY